VGTQIALLHEMALSFVFPDLEEQERDLQRKKAALRDARAALGLI